MSDLLKKLQESFPPQEIPPYGKVICIPSRLFKDQWRQELEAQGLRLVLAGHDGQSCFLVKLKEQEKQPETNSDDKEKPIQEPEKPASQKTILHPQLAWTPEERLKLKQLNSQRLSVPEIAEKLNRSIYSVAAELRHIPDYKPKYPRKSKKKPEENKPETNDPDIVKEFLSASSVLYPSHPRACAFLLKEASDRILQDNSR